MKRDLPHDSIMWLGIISLFTVNACFENKDYMTCIGCNGFIQPFKRRIQDVCLWIQVSGYLVNLCA